MIIEYLMEDKSLELSLLINIYDKNNYSEALRLPKMQIK
jgi:hypothetical protein